MRYRTIVEAQPDLVCRFLADGTLTFVNEAYCNYFGVRRDDIIGRRYLPVVHPEDLPDVEAQVARLNPANPVVSIENRVVRQDGAIRWTEWTNRAIYDEQGHLLEYQSAGRDITERKQAEEDAARLAAIVTSADVAIIGMTLEGTITSWNSAAERMFGYPAAEAIGRSIAFIIPPDRIEEGLDVLERLRRGETVRHLDTERVAADGRRIPISLIVSPIQDARGHIIGISKIARDITERKRLDAAREEAVRREQEARAAAEQASRLKDEFLAILSHELRTPLNAILGWAQMLRDGSVAPEGVPAAIETIERNARAQARLVEDLLDASRFVTGKLSLRMEQVDLGSVVRAAVEAVRPAAANRHIELALDLASPDATVTGDPGRLQQAVWNLLNNAVKFTPAGGRVDVALLRATTDATITVRDTGIGIPPGTLPFIFDRFRQGDSRTTRAHGGLGLGLTIVHYLAKAHGGTVRAESAGPGEGSRFELILPLAASAVPAPRRSSRPQEDVDLRNRHILVVDDDPDARALMRAILERRGAIVTTADSVGEAMAALQTSSPDVLVGDIGMPQRGGYDLIRAVRSEHHYIPAIALTAYAGREDHDAAMQAGYDAHVAKPIDPDTICATIAGLVAARP